MSFKIASRFVEAANVINRVALERFNMLLNRIIQKLHLKNVRLFSVVEEEQLKELFSLSGEDLEVVLACCCYVFEQAAFTNTGPENLYEILLGAGFDEGHAKIFGRLWATEGVTFVNNLKTSHTSIGYNSLESSDYKLSMVLGQSGLTRLQEPTASLSLNILHRSSSNCGGDTAIRREAGDTEVLTLEFSHSELYSLFNDLERVQQQVDCLSANTSQ
jgi:hypothetical protein